mgnify:CR=1 FL=1
MFFCMLLIFRGCYLFFPVSGQIVVIFRKNRPKIGGGVILKNFHFNTDISKLLLYRTSEKLENFWKFAGQLLVLFMNLNYERIKKSC